MSPVRDLDAIRLTEEIRGEAILPREVDDREGRPRRTVTRECPCGDAMTVTTDGDQDFINGLFEHFDAMHADCPQPNVCPDCDGDRVVAKRYGNTDPCSRCKAEGVVEV